MKRPRIPAISPKTWRNDVAGMPRRRAKREAAERARLLALQTEIINGGGELPADFPTVMPSVRETLDSLNGGVDTKKPGIHLNLKPVVRPEKPPKRRRSVPPSGGPPPLSAAEARMFSEARKLSLELVLGFLKEKVDEKDADKTKLRLKQLEIAQGMLSLGGRVDPTTYRGQASDEVGDLLREIKGQG